VLLVDGWISRSDCNKEHQLGSQTHHLLLFHAISHSFSVSFQELIFTRPQNSVLKLSCGFFVRQLFPTSALGRLRGINPNHPFSDMMVRVPLTFHLLPDQTHIRSSSNPVVKTVNMVIKAVAGRMTAASLRIQTLMPHTQVRLTSVMRSPDYQQYMDSHLDQPFRRHYQSQVGLGTMWLPILVRRIVLHLPSSCLPTIGTPNS
jgi:hypothetical protein